MKKYFIKKYIYIVWLLLAAVTANAQQMVNGRVLEKDDNGKLVPVQGAIVFWANTTINTTTDSIGNFSIVYSEGNKRLVTAATGYKNDTLEVLIEKANPLTIVLQQDDTYTIGEVLVEGEGKGITIDRLNPIKANIMTEKELFKAACCNLSESFETNPAVDVVYSDAITGAKQIQMLGLAGIYTQITTENLPGVRGLAAPYGMGYLPGTWIESIQVTKGVGSVANGYESITGQINAEMRKPEGKDKLFANVYANNQGRYEGNLVLGQNVGKNWATGLLLHASTLSHHVDQNKDGFLDMPTGSQLSAINRWNFNNGKTLESQLGVKALIEDKESGQVTNHHGGHNLYKVRLKTERFEVFGKTGYVFKSEKYKSFGLMWNALTHNQQSQFGGNRHNARQQSVYANLIYQSIFGNTHHKYRGGISFLHDNYTEEIAFMDSTSFTTGRVETVPGAFFEYTWAVTEKWMIVSGLRGDFHNQFGFFATPRIHARYDAGSGTVLHFMAGRGQRTANIFAENMQLFATSRQFVLPANWQSKYAYGLQPEVAWNMGVSLTTEIKIGHRYATLEADAFRTEFVNQVVVDLDNTARQVSFYNLNGKSFANSAQVQFTYEPIRRLETRVAYRYYDVKTQYQSGLLQKYLQSPHRAFINVAYKTKSKWMFDVTASWFGSKRLPSTAANTEEYKLPTRSPSFVVVNAQITKTIGKKWDVYAGCENLFDYRQTHLIINPENPTSQYFDASIIWGPIQGRMVYVGARFRMKK